MCSPLSRAESFMAANQVSEVEYSAIEGRFTVFRLADGRKFKLTQGEMEHVRIIWFGFGGMAPVRHRRQSTEAAPSAMAFG